VNRSRSVEHASLLRALAAVVGLLGRDPEAFLQAGADEGITVEAIEKGIEARNAARKARDFSEADRIRDALLAKGVTLEDGPGGTTWRRT
jgi:cysteinyl-tRNA synthetase